MGGFGTLGGCTSPLARSCSRNFLAGLHSSAFELQLESPILRRNAKSASGTRRGSTKGPRADVGGRREGAYRHCVVCCCRLSMDLTTNAIGFLMAYARRWVDLSLWLHAEISPIVTKTSARF